VDEVRRAAAALSKATGRADQARRDLHVAVAQARERGASWAEVGQALGVTRQTAQQRFGRTVIVQPPQPQARPVQGQRRKPKRKR
jgi:hypothetical protein